jgi:hypothetical protein
LRRKRCLLLRSCQSNAPTLTLPSPAKNHIDSRIRFQTSGLVLLFTQHMTPKPYQVQATSPFHRTKLVRMWKDVSHLPTPNKQAKLPSRGTPPLKSARAHSPACQSYARGNKSLAGVLVYLCAELRQFHRLGLSKIRLGR